MGGVPLDTGYAYTVSLLFMWLSSEEPMQKELVETATRAVECQDANIPANEQPLTNKLGTNLRLWGWETLSKVHST